MPVTQPLRSSLVPAELLTSNGELMRRFLRCVPLALGGFLALHAIAQSTPQKPNQSSGLATLDQFVPSHMQKWKVPGLAIAVVQNGKAIYSRGFGLRDVK